MKKKQKTGQESMARISAAIYTRWDGLMYRINDLETRLRMLEAKVEHDRTMAMIQRP